MSTHAISDFFILVVYVELIVLKFMESICSSNVTFKCMLKTKKQIDPKMSDLGHYNCGFRLPVYPNTMILLPITHPTVNLQFS